MASAARPDKYYLPEMFMSVKLFAVRFCGGTISGVRGCEMFVPFSIITVAFAGVFSIVAFVGSKAMTGLVPLMATNKAKVNPKITY
jgi:hypothetical protein